MGDSPGAMPSRSRFLTTYRDRARPTALGADTTAILAELGYGPDDIEALEADGTVHPASGS